MKIIGIICEYNPLHIGHHKHIHAIRQKYPDSFIVCLMSGNYVQRGTPAVFDKTLRAKAALLSGADLVLELPVTAALSSAEGFAYSGVRILGGFCDILSFGAEDPDCEKLMQAAQALLSEEFSAKIKDAMAAGCSFPAARQTVLEQLGCSVDAVSKPNNILATEYCKAIIALNSTMIPDPIQRSGDYNDETIDAENPSATAVRRLILENTSWIDYIPKAAQKTFQDAAAHHIDAGERAILAKLRTMRDDEFEAIPFGSEGLWRKLMKNARTFSTLSDIIDATKSKRYTRTRINRMIMCAFLGLTTEDLNSPAPYVRVLALNDSGRKALVAARKTGLFLNLGDRIDHPYQEIENRCNNLYGLFAVHTPDAPNQKARLYFQE